MRRILGISFGPLDIRLDFEPRDIWVGLFISEPWFEMGRACRSYYVCLIPTFPIVFTTMRRPR